MKVLGLTWFVLAFSCLGPAAAELSGRDLVLVGRGELRHVLRMADGVDVLLGAGTFARFIDAAPVYDDGARLQLVSFDRLPLR